MNDRCCDNCTYYEWYWDKCNKWNCEIDGRSCCSEFIPNKPFSDEYLLHEFHEGYGPDKAESEK